MTDYKQSREKYHQLEADFYKPCEHKEKKTITIINPAIGVEEYEICARCGE